MDLIPPIIAVVVLFVAGFIRGDIKREKTKPPGRR